MVCFGVLPAIIGYSLGIKNTYLIPLIIIYPLAALIRLAYFNTLDICNMGEKGYFVGVPITFISILYP